MTPKPLSTEFVQEFTRVQRPLYLYILAQIGSVTDAEEILQEANVDIVAKCDQFEPGTNFLAWARQIATFEILQWRQGKARDRLRFSDEFVSAIAHEAAEHSETSESERNALEHCLKKLRPNDRKLIQSRYQPGSSGKDLAEQLGRPANSVYQSLGRIRRMLLECIQRQLALRSDPT
ncbi:MAG: sigma-70 family RNA polymerase sigma factor [Planctomycetaceae bacterium]|nr:sigma-70 family RNA polymerase sigma factor [Planctomycetaceae bacterium]